ncbi:hypothetical protein GpartN1_g5273.t1 [Galdieria partita]|uniref:G-patch domain-containing protein n=1 Tax=Galdieria partita TaxID=83374 RepID=A0A9C7Q1J9_9RHOD|nr:hypothetical protein GpartN1_g5273.t1 [Galdieria partita]
MSEKKRSGGKHRYSHKRSKSRNQNRDVVKESPCDKKEMFQASFKDYSSRDVVDDDTFKDLEAVAYNLENLELCGKGLSNVTYIDSYKEEWKDMNQTSESSVEAFLGTASHTSSRDNSLEDESEDSSSQVLNQFDVQIDYESSDSMDSLSSHKIQQMTEEEALDYIWYLKQRIQRIEQVLLARSKSFSKNFLPNTVIEKNEGDGDEEAFGRDSKRKGQFLQPSKRSTNKSSMGLNKPSQEILPSHSKKKRMSQLYSNWIEDEFNYAMSLTASKKSRRRKRSNARQKGKRGSVLQTFRQIRTFLEADFSKTYTFPALSRFVRFAVHRYAEACGIQSRSHGREGKRAVTVIRRSRWKIPNEEVEESILEDIGLGSDKKQNKKNGSQRNDSKKAMAAATTYSARGRKELQKSLAATITEDNIGHRILQTMGWSKGQSLGHPDREEAGLKHPLPVVIRPPRAGLGSHEEET